MKKLLALALCFFLLTACAKQAPPAGTTAPVASTSIPTGVAPDLTGLTGENADSNYLVNDNFQFMTESDSAIYKISSDRNYILYYDKASDFSGPLCGKPDCRHAGTDCDAYIGTGIAIQYYSGSLYFIANDPSSSTSGMWLWKAEPTGKNREKIKQIDIENIVIPYQPQNYFIHRDQLFLFGLTYYVEDGKEYMRAAILVTPLDDSQEYTTLWEEKSESVLEYTYRLSGQYVYVSLVTGTKSLQIFRINFLDKTIEPLFSEDGQGYYYGEIHLTADDEVYLSAATETAVYVWKIENGQKTDTIVIDNSSYYPPKILDGIIFAIDMNEDNKRVVVIKTLSGETVYDGLLFPEDIPEMKLDPNGGVCGVVSGTGSIVGFYVAADANGGKRAEYVVYLDTAQNMKPIYIFPC